MFIYTRKDQTKKKSIEKPAIETKISMPLGMQPIPPPIMETQSTTCIYPDIPKKPGPMKPDIPVYDTVDYSCKMWDDMPKVPPMTDMTKCHNDTEIAYLKKMYPPVCHKIQRYIDGELNQYDHDLSPIYEMYPATETIDHMANCIYTRMKGDLPNVIKEYEGNQDTRTPIGGSFYTLIYALLLNELYRKRMARRLSPRHPYPHYSY